MGKVLLTKDNNYQSPFTFRLAFCSNFHTSTGTRQLDGVSQLAIMVIHHDGGLKILN